MHPRLHRAALAAALVTAAATAASAAPGPGPATTYIGEVRAFAFNFCPQGWAPANGALLPISQNPTLFSLLGTTYGGNGNTTFALPDLRGRGPIGASPDQPVGTVSGAPAGAPQRFLAMTWCIAVQATYPPKAEAEHR